MEYIPMLFIILMFGGILSILIYFIIKRLEDRKKENFEKREN